MPRKALFWLGVLLTVCLGCSGCQLTRQTYFGLQDSYTERNLVMAKNAARSRCDMTIACESGYRERFVCESEDDFRVKAYQYCIQRWKSKGEFGQRLLKDLRAMLEKFSVNGTNSWELGGLTFIPSVNFADENSHSGAVD